MVLQNGGSLGVSSDEGFKKRGVEMNKRFDARYIGSGLLSRIDRSTVEFRFCFNTLGFS